MAADSTAVVTEQSVRTRRWTDESADSRNDHNTHFDSIPKWLQAMCGSIDSMDEQILPYFVSDSDHSTY